MTPRQDRQRLIRMVSSAVEAGRHADAYDLMGDAHLMGRTGRWLQAAGSLRIALHDAACGDEAPVAQALTHAEQAAR